MKKITEEMIMNMTDKEVTELDETIPVENSRTLEIIIQKCLSYLQTNGKVTSGVLPSGDIGYIITKKISDMDIQCNNCNYIFFDFDIKRCPNCGIKNDSI